MVFSSIPFLFFFLPVVLICYWLSSKRFQNLILLAASLFFYSWGEGVYLALMLISILINYCGGQLMERSSSLRKRCIYLTLSITLNLILLGFFKYATFVTENINILLATLGAPPVDLVPIRLPIGISFFTFQALSYLIDVYRKTVPAQKRILNLGLYISLFPQLIAGPIVRYNDIAKAIEDRSTTREQVADGVQRFLMGLAKKVLLANPLAAIADPIFALPDTELTLPIAWLGAICFTLQIYFDFSGYSDMAIGLGRIFGFHFLENFNYPYISRSIREFWRRWHISLSSWFRDYLYIPLGGSRKGTLRTQLNLLIVFLLCGFWHGASWTFIIWGLWHGVFLSLERTPYGTLLEKLWPPIQTAITMLIVIFGWVIFKCETLSQAISYGAVMLGATDNSMDSALLFFYLNKKSCSEILAALVLALPLYPLLLRKKKLINKGVPARSGAFMLISLHLVQYLFFVTISYFAIISLAAGVYNPFIYFRF